MSPKVLEAKDDTYADSTCQMFPGHELMRFAI